MGKRFREWNPFLSRRKLPCMNAWYVSGVLWIVLVGSAHGGNKPPETSPKLLAANQRFAIKLFKRVAETSSDSNVVVAPTGLSMAFALLQNGTSEAVQKEIIDTFEFSDLSSSEINNNAKLLRRDLTISAWKDDNTGTLREFGKGFRLNNSLWIRPSEAFRGNFVRVNRDYYAFNLRTLPSLPVDAVAALNQYIATDTKRKVKSILTASNRDDFFLVTTTHFACGFPHPFEDQGELDFRLPSGRTKAVRMLWNMEAYPYIKGEHFQAVSVTCGSAELRLFLPNESYSVSQFISDLTPDRWREWDQAFRNNGNSRAYRLIFPRFGFDYQIDLRPVLKSLGCKLVFGRPSSLAQAITNPRGAKLAHALQHAFVEVNDREIRAGSVDVIGGIVGGVMGVPPPPVLFFNRPFMFEITDKDTGSILFLGVVDDPS
jgi:serine protease inhibitor